MRIASLSPAVTEILFALERQKLIVCTDHFSDVPAAVRSIPHLRGHQNIDIESLRIHKPDIVFTSTLVQQRLAEELTMHDFAVIHQDPRSLADVYESIRSIGALLDCSARAEALIGQMQQGFNDTKRKAGLLGRRLKVYVEEWHNPSMVSGNWVPEIISLAGGIPFPLSVQQDLSSTHSLLKKNPVSREVTVQEVQNFDPDLIILSICGAGMAASKELLTKREGWASLRAVQNAHVFVVDDSLLNRAGPRLIDGAKRIFGWCFQVVH